RGSPQSSPDHVERLLRQLAGLDHMADQAVELAKALIEGDQRPSTCFGVGGQISIRPQPGSERPAAGKAFKYGIKAGWLGRGKTEPFVFQQPAPEPPAGSGIQYVFAHHSWVIKQPQEASLGNAADRGPAHWHAVEPAYRRRVSSVT